MRIRVNSRRIPLPRTMKDIVRQRVERALGRLDRTVRRVDLRLSDENGPRPGNRRGAKKAKTTTREADSTTSSDPVEEEMWRYFRELFIPPVPAEPSAATISETLRTAVGGSEVDLIHLDDGKANALSFVGGQKRRLNDGFTHHLVCIQRRSVLGVFVH